ncbi:Rrf2 family transcriptional regulator [Herbaspirillum sp. HC18]|nr:Rrf2 family transcriptional regulator [Herbaspirillum sp. HC18]
MVICVSGKGKAAVQALVDVALHQGDGYVVLSAVGERLMLSDSYLEMIFAKLRRHGIVAGIRGPGGGYKLARRAELITVADVMSAMQEPCIVAQLHANEWRVGCSGRNAACIVHALFITLNRTVYEFLESVSLADVVGGCGLDRVSGCCRHTRKKTGRGC